MDAAVFAAAQQWVLRAQGWFAWALVAFFALSSLARCWRHAARAWAQRDFGDAVTAVAGAYLAVKLTTLAARGILVSQALGIAP